MEMKKIRQPIVTVCGHVDHGKTSILDALRGSSVTEEEAGGITQKISFSLFPAKQLRIACPLIEKSGIKLDIPGFLFIDTPGHAAFTNLRKRGGSLADLAVLVIDINDGIKPQTAEVIQILKLNKTPFVIALNKIDNISGWRTDREKSMRESIESQSVNAKQSFDEKYLTLIGSLSSFGLESDLFYNISDFTKKIALVPCSAKTKQGIPELILVLCGLSQKYLSKKIELGKEAKGVILEIKKEKSINYAECILYDGILDKKDEIAVASLSPNAKPVITKIRILEEIQPLSSKFKHAEKVTASTGLRMQFAEKVEVLSGMPFMVHKNNLEEIEKIFSREISENIRTDKRGIIAKADSLGSLEALLALLRQNNISVVKAGIGSINKADVISAKANFETNELDAIIVGFNVSVDEEAKEIRGNANFITGEVIYRLIDEIVKFREEKRKEIEKKRLLGLSAICKLKILHNFVFRNSNPAVFGVLILAGKLISGLQMIDENGNKVGRVKNIQSENKSVTEALEGTEVAISIPGVNFSRTLGNGKFLYTDVGIQSFKNFRKNKDLLNPRELNALREISEIKKIED